MKLSNLTLILTHPNTLYITNKQLKLSTGHQAFSTKSTARVIGQGQIKWDDTFFIPSTQLINFQIVTKHHFGYNPEQLQAVIQGKILFVQKPGRQVKLMTSPVFNIQGQKVGHLKVDCLSHNKRYLSPAPKSSEANNSQIMPQDFVVVNSIIANIDDIKLKTVAVTIKCGQSVKKVGSFSSKAGQLIFIGEYQLKKIPLDQQIAVQLQVQNNGTLIPHSSAIFSINTDGRLAKKAEIKSSSASLGQMFLDGQVVNKNNIQNSHFFLKNQMDGSSFFRGSSKAMGSQYLPGKKITVVNNNHQIRFTREKRFFKRPADQPSSIVSYLGLGNMSFEQKNTKFYKGASIGRGSKHDFSKVIMSNPGVGQYKLPTIWDRY